MLILSPMSSVNMLLFLFFGRTFNAIFLSLAIIRSQISNIRL